MVGGAVFPVFQNPALHPHSDDGGEVVTQFAVINHRGKFLYNSVFGEFFHSVVDCAYGDVEEFCYFPVRHPPIFVE